MEGALSRPESLHPATPGLAIVLQTDGQTNRDGGLERGEITSAGSVAENYWPNRRGAGRDRWSQHPE